VGLWWRCCCLRRVFNEVLVFEWVVCEYTMLGEGVLGLGGLSKN
jgi:hypothetical protein